LFSFASNLRLSSNDGLGMLASRCRNFTYSRHAFWYLIVTKHSTATEIKCEQHIVLMTVSALIQLTSLLCNQPRSGSERWSPTLKDRGSNNALPGEGYCIPIERWEGTMVAWLAWENWCAGRKKPAPVPLYPLWTSHEITQDWTQGSTMRS
jgi:hypothetical protein